MRTALSLLLLLGLATPAFAKAPDEVQVYAWDVVRSGAPAGEQPDLLIGTMHVDVPEGKRLPEAVTSRIAQADRFTMEVDVSAVTPALLGKYITLAPGLSLKRLMGPDSYPKLVALGAKFGLAEPQLATLDPWFLSLSFLNTQASTEGSMDEQLREQAAQASVPVTFLETADEQFRILDSISIDEDVRQLKEVLADPDKPAKELAELEEAYAAGDVHRLEALVYEPARIREYPDFYRKLFYERNARWEPTLRHVMAEHDAVMAVGLGHLLGPRGLLAMLQGHGYRVTPLTL